MARSAVRVGRSEVGTVSTTPSTFAPLQRWIIKRAGEMRKVMTPPEIRLWLALRRLRSEGFHFRRQVPIRGYFLDFVCPAGASSSKPMAACMSTASSMIGLGTPYWPARATAHCDTTMQMLETIWMA
jgi:hypothetical protein